MVNTNMIVNPLALSHSTWLSPFNTLIKVNLTAYDPTKIRQG